MPYALCRSLTLHSNQMRTRIMTNSLFVCLRGHIYTLCLSCVCFVGTAFGHSNAHTQDPRRGGCQSARAHAEQHAHGHGAHPVLLVRNLPGGDFSVWKECLTS